ncbi:MAG: hypothetical protein UMU76_00035 [Prosthecochloris sp.]|nr:hypothetical protein [Prosthecochloris sp.]
MMRTIGSDAAETAYRTACGSVIWSIMFLDNGMLVGEERSEGGRKTSFFAVAADGRNVVMRDFVLPEPAGDEAGTGVMTGLETTAAHLCLLHRYHGQGPEHVGLWAVDPVAGRVVWQRPDVSFAAHLGKNLLVYRTGSFAGFPERSYLVIDAVSGEVVEQLGDDAGRANMLRMKALREEDRQGVVLPGMRRVAEGIAAQHRNLVDDEFRPESAYEYIERDDLFAGAVHRIEQTASGAVFSAELLVYRNGKKWFSDTICTGSSQPCMNYFLVRGVHMYYIRNRRELVSLHL